ncbi:hypothetical protein [Haloparvum sedimenti]|uniref:hypothetical protein n=1 Tax=Haloparvum sedimenti TaxID=1678448 RepID=UPI00071E6CE2|nr:hypothetical protein [Haloparvum sedimenti]
MADAHAVPKGVGLDALREILAGWSEVGAAAEPRYTADVADATGYSDAAGRQTRFLEDLGVLDPTESGQKHRLTDEGEQLAGALAIDDEGYAREHAADLLREWPVTEELRAILRGNPTAEEDLIPLLATVAGVDPEKRRVETGLSTLLDLYEWAGLLDRDEEGRYRLPGEADAEGSETSTEDEEPETGGGSVKRPEPAEPPTCERRSAVTRRDEAMGEAAAETAPSAAETASVIAEAEDAVRRAEETVEEARAARDLVEQAVEREGETDEAGAPTVSGAARAEAGPETEVADEQEAEVADGPEEESEADADAVAEAERALGTALLSAVEGAEESELEAAASETTRSVIESVAAETGADPEDLAAAVEDSIADALDAAEALAAAEGAGDGADKTGSEGSDEEGATGGGVAAEEATEDEPAEALAETVEAATAAAEEAAEAAREAAEAARDAAEAAGAGGGGGSDAAAAPETKTEADGESETGAENGGAGEGGDGEGGDGEGGEDGEDGESGEDEGDEGGTADVAATAAAEAGESNAAEPGVGEHALSLGVDLDADPEELEPIVRGIRNGLLVEDADAVGSEEAADANGADDE